MSMTASVSNRADIPLDITAAVLLVTLARIVRSVSSFWELSDFVPFLPLTFSLNSSQLLR